MLVKNLVSWAGDRFSYAPGDEIELDDDLAHARVAHGLASYTSKQDAAAKPKVIKFAAKHPKVVEQEAREKARAAKGAPPHVGGVPATLAAQVNELNSQLLAERAEKEAFKARLEALEKRLPPA